MLNKILLAIALFFTQSKDYDTSEYILNQINSSEIKYYYIRMINNCALNNKKETLHYSNLIIDDWREFPTRYLHLATIIRNEVETWKENDLEALSRDMNKVRDRIINGKIDKETKRQQDEIANKLKGMIEEIENKKKKEQEEQEKKEQEEKEQREKEQQRKEELEIPPDTHRNMESGEGKVDRKKIREIAEVWGKLPEKERASYLKSMMRSLPPGDRRLIEKYFQELQRRGLKSN